MLVRHSPFLRRKKQSDDAIKKQKEIDIRIKQLLQQEKAEYNSTHRLLMLGLDGSGKTSIFNLVSKMELADMNDNHRRQRIPEIRSKIRDSIVTILTAMEGLKLSVSSQNESHAQFLLSTSRGSQEYDDYSEKFFDSVERLWSDENVQKCYERRSEYKLLKSAGYFLDRIDFVKEKDYIPSNDDLLQCKELECGISESKLEIGGHKFQIFKMSKETTDVRNWHHYFTDALAIVYVVDSSSYDEPSSDGTSKTRLRESLDMFESIRSNDMLKKIPVILFLNKSDLLQKKVLSCERPLEKYFPEFKNYTLPVDATDEDGNAEISKAKYFIRDEFLRLCQQGCEAITPPFPCYAHFSRSNDLDNISWIFHDSCKIYARRHLHRYNLL